MDATLWPDLPYSVWRDTAATLQLWTQGKVRLALTPWLNHSWQVPLYVTARGLGTSPIPLGHEILELEFDFIGHRLLARTSRGEERTLPLEPQTVAEFYRRVVDVLNGIGVAVAITDLPNEVPHPIPFSQAHTHASYDAAAAHRIWRVLVRLPARRAAINSVMRYPRLVDFSFAAWIGGPNLPRIRQDH